MQSVSLAILQAEMRREGETGGGSLTMRVVSAGLDEKEDALQAYRVREEQLRQTISQLQLALRQKDDQLWRMAQSLAENSIHVPANSIHVPDISPPIETSPPAKTGLAGLSVAPQPPLLSRTQAAGAPANLIPVHTAESTPTPAQPLTPTASVSGESVGSKAEPSGSQTAREMTAAQRDVSARRKSSIPSVRAVALALRTATTMSSPRNRASSVTPAAIACPTGSASEAEGGGAFAPRAAGAPAPAPEGAPSVAPSPSVRRQRTRRWSEPSSAGELALAASQATASLSGSSPSRFGVNGSSHGLSRWGQVAASLTGSSPGRFGLNGSGHGANRCGKPEPTCIVLRQGLLTKLSKGGFTANWNRRSFALIGSSLYYAKDSATLATQPKLFAEIAGCEVHPWSEQATWRSHVFAVHLLGQSGQNGGQSNGKSKDGSSRSDDDSAHGGRTPNGVMMLLLAADSPRDKYAWIDAITQGALLPRCPADRVGPTLALQMNGGSVDAAVSPAPFAAIATRAVAAARFNKGLVDHDPHADSHHDSSPAVYSTEGESPPPLRGSHRGRERQSRRSQLSGSRRDAGRDSPEGPHAEVQWWNPEKWFLPEMFKNV